MAWVFGFAETVELERFKSLETGRVEIGKQYLEIIADRPFLGLLETEGESFLRSEFAAEAHAHNGYLETLYIGGIMYGLPTFFLVGYTGLCILRSWRNRRMILADPLLISFLIAFMVMVYAHGFVNHSLFYPTTTLAFVHVLLSVLFMGIAMDLMQEGQALAPLAVGTEDLMDEVEYDDEYSYDDAAETAS